MGASEATDYLTLPVFVDDDKPTWLGDFNDSMRRIDDAVRADGVEIEQFTGATDADKFDAAIAYLLPIGGKLKLRSGKVYNLTRALTTVDFTVYGKLIVIEAWGAIINCNVPGDSWVLQKVLQGAAFNTLFVFGGEWNNTDAAATSFFHLLDMGRSFWFRVRANCPQGAGWHQENFSPGGFSENNHYIEIYDPGSKHTFKFSRSVESLHGSMARTVMRGINVQGGMADEPKINIGDGTALYSSILDGFTGNLATNAIGMRLAGNMHGFQITGNIGLENSIGVTGVDFSYYFTVGELLGGPRATLATDIPDNQNTMIFMHPGSLQPHLYGVLNLPPGVRGVGSVKQFSMLNSDAPIALPATAETQVFAVTVTEPGEYKLDAHMMIATDVAATSNNVQTHINGGTATYDIRSLGSTQATIASDATATKQARTFSISTYLIVSVPGTILVTARASAAAHVVPTTPISGYSHATGYTIEQFA